MSSLLPVWLANPHANYVLAAYAAAAFAFLGLLLSSHCAARRREKIWRALEARRAENSRNR